MAVFANLPEEPLFTVNPDIPHAWMVEPVSALHDLDNINLASVEHGVHGDYELEHVLVEGVCVCVCACVRLFACLRGHMCYVLYA